MEKLLWTIRESNSREKVVIASNFLTTLDLIEAEILSRWNWTKLCYRLDGKTPQDSRAIMIESFNRPILDPNDTVTPFVFLLSNKAGGVGINL